MRARPHGEPARQGRGVLSASGTTPFRPAWWCRSPHCQTLWPHLFRRRPSLTLRRERLELPDGDFLDLAWSGPERGPLVLVLHGLEGSLRSHYAASLIDGLVRSGLGVVFMHFRNCGGEPNRLPRSYHSGETGDLERLATQLVARTGQPLLAVVGFSLGGNVLLKWLGERGDSAPIRTAVAVSVPFLLGEAAERMETGWSRLYQWQLVRSLRRSYRRKLPRLSAQLPVDAAGLERLRTFRTFDDRVTAPLHGFAGVDDYYTRSSSRQFLRHIRRPTLILHAADDPFMWPRTVPTAPELSPSVQLEVSAHGGHVGFVAGRWPWRPEYWLDARIIRHIHEHRSR
jgi:hypothetical protein